MMTDQGRPSREPSLSIREDEIEVAGVVGHHDAAAAAASGGGDKGVAKTKGKGKKAGWGGGRRADEGDTFRLRRSVSTGGDFSGGGYSGGSGGGWTSWGGGWRSGSDNSSEDSGHSSPPSPASFSPAAWLSPRPVGSGKGDDDGDHPGPFWGAGARPSRIESEDSLGTSRRSGGGRAKGRGGGTAVDVGARGGELHSVAEATRGGGVTGAGGVRRTEARNSPSSHGSSSSVEGGPLMKFFASVSGGGAKASGVGGKSGVSGRRKAVMSREERVSGGPDAPLSVPATRKKKTFMEKFGEMLEAAAETAVPSNPVDSAPKRPSKALGWEDWDAAALGEFMAEEARTMVDSSLVEEVKRATGDKEKLVGLAKAWHVPFVSQSDFNKQKVALRNPVVGTVSDDGRCVPAASLPRKTRKSSVTTSSIPSSILMSGTASLPSLLPASSESLPSQRRSPPENAPRGEVGARVNGGVLASTKGDGENQKENRGDIVDELAGTTVYRGWIVRAAVLEKRDCGVFGAGDGGGEESVSPCYYYLVEVEALGGSRGGGGEDEGGGAWACYKRYSDFFALWRGLCRLHPALAEPKEGLREGWGVEELLSLGGVLFPGVNRALERWRMSKLNGMLKAMLKLNPRPQELVRFLEPHAAVRNDRTSAVTEDTAQKSRRNPVEVAGERSRVRGRHRRGGGRDSATTTTTTTTTTNRMRSGSSQDLTEVVAIALPVTPSLALFLAVFAVVEACSAMHAAGFDLVRSVEISAVVAWAGVAAFAGFDIFAEARWLREVVRGSIFSRKRQQRGVGTGTGSVSATDRRWSLAGLVDGSGVLEGETVPATEEASVGIKQEIGRSAVGEGGGAGDGEAKAMTREWVRVAMGVEILAAAIVLLLYLTSTRLRQGSESNGGGGVASGDAPARDGAWLLASVVRFVVREAVCVVKGVVMSVMLAVVGPLVVAAVAAQGVMGDMVDGGGGGCGDVASGTVFLSKEATLRLVVLGGGGIASLVCGASVVMLPLLVYLFARLSSLSNVMGMVAAVMPFGRHNSVVQQQKQEQKEHAVVGSSQEEASRKGDVEGKGLLSSSLALRDGKAIPGQYEIISVDSPRTSLWLNVRRRVKARVDRLRVSVARAVIPKGEGVLDLNRNLNRNHHSDGNNDDGGEDGNDGEDDLKVVHHQQQQLSIAEPVKLSEGENKTPAWRFQGALKKNGFEWASPALRSVDLFAAAVYASEEEGDDGEVLCCSDGTGGVSNVSRGVGGLSSSMLLTFPGEQGRVGVGLGGANAVGVEGGGGEVGVTGGGGGAFGSLADVVLTWSVVVLMCATHRRECRLARRKEWGRLALALSGKLVVGGWLLGTALLWNASLSISPPLSLGGGSALSLCAVEAYRCVAALVLILSIVQGASENVRSKRSNSRGGVYDPTTPRGEHLVEPLILPAATTEAFGRRSKRRAPATARRSSGGSGPTVASEGKGGWFSGSLHGGALGRGGAMGGEMTSSSLHDPRGSPGGRGHESASGVWIAGSREPWMRRVEGSADGGHERE